MFFLPFGLSAGTSAADAAIEKNIYGTGASALIIANEEMRDFMKIVKSLEKTGLLIKVISETVKNEANETTRGFLGMLLGTLGASRLGMQQQDEE